jgi:hypothetical protein
MHGTGATEAIKQGLEKVDARGLTNLSDGDYQQFVNQFSGQFNPKTAMMPTIPVATNPNSVSPNKRHLPIVQKKMVYNEWGALIRHQDEMDQALKIEEQIQNNIIKQKYAADLDQQRAGVARKHREEKEMDALAAQSMLEYQKQKDYQRAMTEDAKRQQLQD